MRMLIVALASAATVTPAALLRAIATTPWPAAGLPAHVTVVQSGAVAVSAQGRRYHAIGEIAFLLKGPDPSDEVIFEVFPNAADARGDITHPHLSSGNVAHGAVDGIAWSALITGGLPENGHTIGVSVAAAAQGNVIVEAIASSATKTRAGDSAEATALLKAGLAHLRTLGGVSTS